MNRNEKAMLFAEGIVARYKERGNQLPHRSKTCRMDPNRQQEYKDAAKLNDWKQSLKGNRGSCSIEVRDYLDEHLPLWRANLRANRQERESARSISCSSSDSSDHESIEAEVCSAMMSKFATHHQPRELSPSSVWSDFDTNDMVRFNSYSLSCDDKRVDVKKRKRLEMLELEWDKDDIEQIRKDSELLLHLSASKRHDHTTHTDHSQI